MRANRITFTKLLQRYIAYQEKHQLSNEAMAARFGWQRTNWLRYKRYPDSIVLTERIWKRLFWTFPEIATGVEWAYVYIQMEQELDISRAA